MKKHLCVLGCLALVLVLFAACDRTNPDVPYDVIENLPESLSEIPEAGDVQDMALCGQTLYLATTNGLYVRDVLNDTNERISETVFSVLESDGETIYAYTAGTNVVSCFVENAETETVTMPDGFVDERLIDFTVTERYFVFLTNLPDGFAFSLYHRDTAQTEYVPTLGNITEIAAYRYTENVILLYYSANNNSDCYVAAYHLDTDQFEEKYYVDLLNVCDIAYDAYHNTVFLYGKNITSGAMALQELLLDDGSVRTLIQYEMVGTSFSVCRMALSSNLVCCLMGDQKTVQIYDMEKDYPVVNVALTTYPQMYLQYMASYMQTHYHITVNFLEYKDDDGKQKLNMKLQAGDADIDLYDANLLEPAYYVRAGAYVDLNTIESLQAKFAASPYATAAASWNGTIIGVPTEAYFFDSAVERNADGTRDNSSVEFYMARYIGAAEKRYDDPDGTALAELYRHLAEYPEDDAGEPLWGEFSMIFGGLVMMNPNAAHKEEAALFLEELLCLYMGEREEDRMANPMAAMMVTPYPEVDVPENVYRKWTGWNQSVYTMIRDGAEEVQKGADAAQTAAKVAADIRMAVQE